MKYGVSSIKEVGNIYRSLRMSATEWQLVHIEGGCIAIRTAEDRFSHFSLDEAITLNYELARLLPILVNQLKQQKQAQINKLQQELNALG